MSRIAYVRFYASDWRSGCIGLSFEQEGFYIRVCAYIFETSRRLPLNDSAAAKIMGSHTNAYRPIRDQLVKLGLLQRYDDGYTVRRAELEVAMARKARTAKEEGVDSSRGDDAEERADGGAEMAGRVTGGVSLGDTPGDTPVVTPLDIPPVTHGVFSNSSNENNGPLSEPVTEPIEVKSPLPPKGARTTKGEYWKNQLNPEPPHAGIVRNADGSIALLNGTHANWLKKFDGDAERLDLALTEAAGEVRMNSPTPFEAQVSRVLARILGQKRDRAANYDRAVKNNANAKPKSDGPDYSRWVR